MNPQRIILKFKILKRLNTSNTRQKRGCVVICTSRHRKQKIGNDIHPRSLTSQFAPEKWMESCFPFLDPVLYQGRAVINFGDLRGVYIKSTLVSSHPKLGGRKQCQILQIERNYPTKTKFHFLYKLHLFNWNLPFNIVDDAITTGDSWYLRSLDEKSVGPST